MTFLLTDYFLTALSAVLCLGCRSRGRMEDFKGRKNHGKEKMLEKREENKKRKSSKG
jgi:hypothetical protein